MVHRPSALTMATPTSPLSLVLPMTNCRDYLSSTETDNFCGNYAAVLVIYTIDPTDAAATAAPADVAQLIYAMAQEGILTAFIQWQKGARGRGTHIALF